MNRSTEQKDRTRFTRGSSNVFADLDLPEPEVELAKARLAESIADTICRRGLVQAEAAGIIGIDQGSVSKLVNGRLEGFSQERLIRYLTALGDDVEIIIRHPAQYGSAGHLTVTAE